MKIKNEINFTVSIFYITAILYGDISGIEDKNELKQLESFIDKIGRGCITILEDTNDFRTCEISGLKSDTIDILVTYFEGV